MAVKYYIRYFDIKGIEHRLNIYDDSFNDEAIQIDGDVVMTYSDTDDNLEAIRGQGLRVNLQANTGLTFNDLWSEDEKTFPIDYYRDNELLFKGWLNPDGFFEDYVGTDWIVSFDCVDGLGFLQNLSFVDSNGFPITGKKTYLQLLSLALIRTGLELDINTSIGIKYYGLDDSLDILPNVYAYSNRYIKDDGETIMSCEEVIRDILEPFGAVLTSYRGEWYIYKPNELYNTTSLEFYRYSPTGNAYGPPVASPTRIVDFGFILGSDINGYYPHHCSANQRIRNVSSLGAYRISYKYGLVKSLLENTNLYSPDGVTIPDFTIVSPTNMHPLVAGESGVTFNNIGGSPFVNLRTQGFSIEGNFQVDLSIDFTFSNFSSFGYAQFITRIVLSNRPNFTDPTATKYYLKQNLTEWSTSVNQVVYVSGTGNQLFEFRPPVVPTAFVGGCYMFLEIMSPQFYWTALEAPMPSVTTDLNVIRISPSESTGENTNVIGEFHTFQRTTKPSARIDSIKEVKTGDNIADFYEGTLYKNDKVTPTEIWNRKGVEEEKPLLQIMGEENMRLNQKPTRIFSGDVFGYFPYLSVISIYGLEGKYLPIKYSYDTKNNIINAEFKQIYGDELNDIDYQKTLDYGNTVKPTIR